MTFARAFITAWMAAALVRVEAHGGDSLGLRLLGMAVVAACGWVWWRYCTTDPLPDAIDRGLERYAERWRNGR